MKPVDFSFLSLNHFTKKIEKHHFESKTNEYFFLKKENRITDYNRNGNGRSITIWQYISKI